MRDRGNTPGKAVPTAAAAAARRGMLPSLLALLARFIAPARTPYSLADLLQATVPGYENIRFYADMSPAELTAKRPQFIPQSRGSDGRASWLALSSGGAGGAFGAGILTGWSERGDRPMFDLVTGVSAGALIAPFAFIGSKADRELASLFTGKSVAQLNHGRSLLSGIFGQSAIPAKPLRTLIDAHVDADLIQIIAARHRAGARLLVVTTNLDAQRSVVWDIGAIACSDRPNRLQLIGDVLEASASLPAIFPPVKIAVSGNGKVFDELHADGGAIRQIYLLPDAFLDVAISSDARPDIYCIVNSELAPRFSVVPQQSIQIAERALSSLEKSGAARSVAELAAFARQAKATFRLAFIDRTIPVDRRVPFDPGFMLRAYALGQSKGRGGTWAFGPPVGTDLLEDNGAG